MEVRGLILLRISEAEYGRITIAVDNEDKLGFQLQVRKSLSVRKTIVKAVFHLGKFSSDKQVFFVL